MKKGDLHRKTETVPSFVSCGGKFLVSGKNLIFKFVRKISFRRLQHCSDELWWKRIPLFSKLLEKLVRKATLICWAHTIKLGPWYQHS